MTAEPWLKRTGLPRDTLGLQTVVQYYQDVCLDKDSQAEQKEQVHEQLKEKRAKAKKAAELHKSLLRYQRKEHYILKVCNFRTMGVTITGASAYELKTMPGLAA